MEKEKTVVKKIIMGKAYFKGYSTKKSTDFLNKKCLLPISIGQKYHEGDKFESIINLINTHFDSCVIVVCDSLYRYTGKLGHPFSLEQSYMISMKNGERWLNDNKGIIEKIIIPTKIYRWDYWVFKNKNYIKYRESINYLYATDKEVKKAFDSSVAEFIERYRKKVSITYDKEAYSLCLRYLKEECAALIAIWKNERYDCIIYPGKQAEAIEITCKKCIHNKNSNPIEWLQPMFINNPMPNLKYIEETLNDENLSYSLEKMESLDEKYSPAFNGKGLNYFINNLNSSVNFIWVAMLSIFSSILIFVSNFFDSLYAIFIDLFGEITFWLGDVIMRIAHIR